MRTTPLPRSAAWVRWRKDRDWLARRDALTADWILDRAHAEGGRVVVQGMSHVESYRHGDGSIAKIARQGDVATYRSPVTSGPTLVPDPDIRLLATAMSTADGQSLAATESATFPLIGWAMATRAVDLETGEPTPDTRTDEQIEMLEAFADQLYNGWEHKQVGRRASAHYLPRLADSGMTYETFVGSLIAIDPGHLDSNQDVASLKEALPPVWKSQREQVSKAWRL